MRTHFYMSIIATAAAFCFFLTACQSIESSPVTARLAVSYATLKVIENTDAEHQQARREAIHKIATDAKSLLAGEAVTLPLLEAAIRERIDFGKLSPADTFLANALLAAVIQELQNRVGLGTLAPAQVLVVNMVLDWVIEATAV